MHLFGDDVVKPAEPVRDRYVAPHREEFRPERRDYPDRAERRDYQERPYRNKTGPSVSSATSAGPHP